MQECRLYSNVTIQGIQLPSSNTTVRSIIESFVPTIFATLVEPTWAILNRVICLLQPFEELRKGNTIASRSLDVKYTTVPPQLAVWRALRSRHFLLAVVCIVAVSTNVLAVALAALLKEFTISLELAYNSSSTLTPVFSNSDFLFTGNTSFEQYYVSLLIWVSLLLRRKY